jgi:DNA-binding response OmpR family regulator
MKAAAQRPCLLIARDPAPWRSTFDAFAAYGVGLAFANDLESALAALQSTRPVVVLIDAVSLGADYIALLRGLVGSTRAPIVVLLDPADERGQIMALEVGAADVISRPSSPRLLLARLNRLSSAMATTAANASKVNIGVLQLDAATRTACAGDFILPLTASEFDVLFVLAMHPDRPVHRDAIARQLGRDDEGGRSADMAVCRIRRKLRDARVSAVRINTSYGRGYTLAVEGARTDDSGAAAPLIAVGSAKLDALGAARGGLLDLLAVTA